MSAGASADIGISTGAILTFKARAHYRMLNSNWVIEKFHPFRHLTNKIHGIQQKHGRYQILRRRSEPGIVLTWCHRSSVSPCTHCQSLLRHQHITLTLARRVYLGIAWSKCGISCWKAAVERCKTVTLLHQVFFSRRVGVCVCVCVPV